MNAKHLSKNTISHKFVFLAVGIAIAIIAAFSICLTSQAKAQTDDNANVSWILKGEGGKYQEYFTSSINELPDWNDGDDVLALAGIEGTISKASVYQVTSLSANGVTKELHFVFEFDPVVSFNTQCFLNIYSEVEDSGIDWSGTGITISTNPSEPTSLDLNKSYYFADPKTPLPNLGFNVSGHVSDVNDVWQAVPGAFVQYCQWNPWFWDYVPVPEMNTFTDWFGNFTLEGIEEDMLPGVIRVYRFGYEVAESAPIWFVPEGLDTIYRFVEMTPAEPPVPPTPPTPPDPPVPPVPPQPDPPQPVPPTPVPPTPVDPGTNVPQTSDAAGYAFTIFAMMALLSAGVLAGRKLYVK